MLCVVFYEFEDRSPEGEPIQHTITAEGDAVETLYHEIHQFKSEIQNPYMPWDLEVFVYRPVSAGDFSVSLTVPSVQERYLSDRGGYFPEYRFSVDEQLRITETDPYSWVPDCAQEYQDFQLENGTCAAHGNQIAFCLNYSIRAGDMGKYQYTETVSSDAVRLIGRWSCAAKEAAETGRTGPVWASYQQIAVYEAVSDGDAEIAWELKDKEGNPFQLSVVIPGMEDANASQRVSGLFRITDNAQTVLGTDDARITFAAADTGEPLTVAPGSGFSLYRRMEKSVYSIPTEAKDRGTITKYDNGSYDIEFRLISDSSGDVNRDRILNKADVTALIRWLTADPELQIADWAAADRSKDQILSAVDLTLMKRRLIEPDAAGETDVITAATKLPVIEDQTGDISDQMKAALAETVRRQYPGSDLSDFKLVYDPEHPLTEKAGGPCFYVYYQGTLVHGLGDLDLLNNVYAAFDKNGKVTLQLLAAPEAFLSVDLSGQDVSEIWMNERKKGHVVDRIVYAKRDDKEKPLRVAYRVMRTDVPLEEICDEIGAVLVTIDHTPPKKDASA